MVRAGAGNTVKIHYTGRLRDGTIFASSRDRAPLGFTLGEGQVIRGLESAVAGMSVGEKKTVTVPAGDAYGPRRNDMVIRVERSRIPPVIELSAGKALTLKQESGFITVTVTDLDDYSVTLDANHPLAGNDLTFDIELLEVA